MTRLLSDDISGISSQLKAYDEELVVKTGHSLKQVACHAAGLGEDDAGQAVSRIRVGVVPIQWGQGVIEGFCNATAAILAHLGFEAFVTRHPDISGFAEAFETRPDVIFSSDDRDFVALNAVTRQYVHNAVATGKGFAAGLDLMAGGVASREALVLGCGAVGRSCALSLLNYGARVSIYDINPGSFRNLRKALSGTDADRIAIEVDLRKALSENSLVVDATNASGIIQARDISARTIIAAPGMPLGLSRDAQKKIRNRLLHDPLQIGVATMGMTVVKQLTRHDSTRIAETHDSKY